MCGRASPNSSGERDDTQKVMIIVPESEGNWLPDDTSGMLRSAEQIAWTVNSTDQVSVAMERLVEAIRAHTPWAICWVGLVDIDGDTASGLQFHAGFKSGSWRDWRSWPVEGSPSVASIAQQTPLTIRDVHNDPRFPRLGQQGDDFGFSSVLVIPIYMNERSGALWVCRTEPHDFTGEEISFASMVASLAAIALNNLLLVQQERELQRAATERRAELETLNALTQTQNDDLQRLAHVHAALLRAATADSGLDVLTERVAQLLEMRIGVFDEFGELVAMSPHASAELEKALHMALADPRSSDDHGRATTQRVDGGHQIIAEIQLGSASGGTLVALSSSATVAAVEVTAVEQATLVYAVYFSTERTRIREKILVRRDIAEALLINGSTSAKSTRRRAAALGLNASATNQIFRIRCSARPGSVDGLDTARLAEAVHRQLDYAQTRSVVIPLDEADLLLIVEVPTSAENDRWRAVAARVRRVLLDIKRGQERVTAVAIGVGGLAETVSELRESQRQASEALAILEALGRADTDLHFAEAGSYSLLLSANEQQADRLVDRYLQPLLDYDSSRNAALTQTVSTYLNNLGNARKTADELFLHLTTVKYRLGRAETELGMSLDDPDIRLCIQMALRHRDLTRRKHE
jgi:purine catabolism regulator